jgi:8-hydroxy-5-deazaflavin:NADPH oxidoreductase
VPIADVTLSQKRDANLLDQFEFDVVDAGPLVEGRDFEKDTPAYCVPLDSKK